MFTIGRHRHEPALANGKQVVQTHQPRHSFMIDFPTLCTQSIGDATVTILPVLQRDPLDGIAQA
jgi:hypothetical protein